MVEDKLCRVGRTTPIQNQMQDLYSLAYFDVFLEILPAQCIYTGSNRPKQAKVPDDLTSKCKN